MMMTHRQRLLFPMMTPRAILACVSGVDFDQRSPGTLSLVRKFVEKARPRYIVNLFSEFHSRKTFDVQILDRNQVVVVYQMTGNFVLEVVTLIKDLSVNGSQYCNRFVSAARTFLSAGYTPLSNPKFLLDCLIVTRIFNLRSVRECDERFNSYVKSDRLVRDRQRLFGNVVTGHDSEPFRTLALDRDFFNRSLNLAMLSDFNEADISQSELAVNEAEALTVVEKAIEKRSAFETRESGTFARFASAEKCLESLIRLSQNLIAYTGLNKLIFGASCSDVRNLFTLVKKGNADAVEIPSVTPFLNRGVVKIAAQIQRSFKAFDLCFIRVEPEFIR